MQPETRKVSETGNPTVGTDTPGHAPGVFVGVSLSYAPQDLPHNRLSLATEMVCGDTSRDDGPRREGLWKSCSPTDDRFRPEPSHAAGGQPTNGKADLDALQQKLLADTKPATPLLFAVQVETENGELGRLGRKPGGHRDI